ncbi:MAG: hypothetical protein AAGJ79_04605 [Verrucomicrobiota bacterium]
MKKIIPAFFLWSIAAIAPAVTIVKSGDFATVTQPENGFISDAAGSNFTAAQFTVTDFVLIEELVFEGHYLFSTPEVPIVDVDDFTVGFFPNGTGAPIDPFNPAPVTPEIILQVITPLRTDTGINVSSAFSDPYDIYRYEALLPVPVALVPGTYWVAIANDTSSFGDFVNWTWNFQPGASLNGINTSGANIQGPYFNFGFGTPIYELEGSIIPEPSIGLLALVGAIAAFGRRRRSVQA